MAMFTIIGTAVGATAASAFAVGLGTTALVAGAVGYSMYASNQAKKKRQQQQSQMPKAPDAPKMVDQRALAQKQATEKRRSMARSQSVKTNPLGIKDEAQVARKQLLGG